jgi:prepilin-type N-terminal cleavage/methylation domain-containing protein
MPDLSSWRRSVKLRRDHDEGFSLVELLVSMTIFSVLMMIVFSVLIKVSRDTGDAMSRGDQVEQMRLGLMQIDRQVRSGNVISDPNTETVASSGVSPGYSMRVYTQTDGVFQCVQWRMVINGGSTVDGQLQYRSWDPAWRSTGDVRPWGVVARHLASLPADDPATPNVNESLPFQKNAAAAASKAQSIRVTLWHKSAGSAKNSKASAVTSVLTGRNTVYGYPADECSDIPAP